MTDKQLYSEVYAVISSMGEDYISAIPKEFWQVICSQRDTQYACVIDENKGLHEQGLSKDTLAMIAMLKLDYWCKTEQEKADLLNVLQTNENEIKSYLEQATNTRELLQMFKKK